MVTVMYVVFSKALSCFVNQMQSISRKINAPLGALTRVLSTLVHCFDGVARFCDVIVETIFFSGSVRE